MELLASSGGFNPMMMGMGGGMPDMGGFQGGGMGGMPGGMYGGPMF